MKYRRAVLIAILLASVLAGCGTPQAIPLQDISLSAPWQDGEESYYEVRASGTPLGNASWRWKKAAAGWLQAYEVVLSSRADRGETELDNALMPVFAWRTVGEARYEAGYSPELVVITTTVGTTVTVKEMTRSSLALDNDQTLQTQRALPFAPGLAVSYLNIIPTTGSSAAVRVAVDGPVTLTVPAGAFAAWHATMSFGALKHEAWYAVEAPHLLLRYTNNSAGTEFVLRSWRPAAGAAMQGSQEPAPAPPDLEANPPQLVMNWPYFLFSLLFQVPVMIGVALLAGWWIRRRFGIGWNIFLYGAAAFVASQVVHIPVNWLLGLLGTQGGGVSAWPLPLMALVAGASAGLCEQGVSWLALRFIWKKVRSYPEGLQYGAGHGAVEAGLGGLLSLVTLINIVTLYARGAGGLGLSAEQTQEVVQAFGQVLNTPLYMPFIAALERVCALVVQILMGVLVAKSLAEKKPLLWLAAFGIHTLLDTWAVYGSQTVGILATEAGILAMAVAAGWLLWKLRAPAADTLY